MAIVVCTCATGSPGVTTTTLGLALTWPRDVLLCDCDRDPSQTVLSGFLRGINMGGRGLNALAKAHREQERVSDELPRQSVPLTLDENPSRRFLPGFSHPGSASLFYPVWPELADALNGLDDLGVDAVVDAGRIGGEGLPNALASSADVILVLVRSSLRSLAATHLYLPALREHLDSLPGHPQLGLLVVGPGRPYSNKEIEQALGVPVWGDVAYDSADAAVLTDGKSEPRRFAERPLMRSMRSLASATRARLDEQQRRIQGNWVPDGHNFGAFQLQATAASGA
jgi:hypothetical protein